MLRRKANAERCASATDPRCQTSGSGSYSILALDLTRRFQAGKPGHQVQGHVDPGGYAGRGPAYEQIGCAHWDTRMRGPGTLSFWEIP